MVYALNRLLELGNVLAYLESRAFAKRRMGLAGLLFDAHVPIAGDLARAARAM